MSGIYLFSALPLLLVFGVFSEPDVLVETDLLLLLFVVTCLLAGARLLLSNSKEAATHALRI